MSRGSEKATEIFDSGFNCAQAVFTSHCEEMGLDMKTALKTACAFGSGMGCIGGTCGAVTGAFMLIGLKYGKHEPEDNAARDKTYALVREFNKRFTAEFGSIACKDLLPYDISMSGELAKARESGVFRTICPKLVKRATEIVEELLEID
ncbi:MAG: C-GCAxxG-C-C family protein [Clostridia bacterium]|nr:C-GCAxxG-C-C family protein [Clostridia bacterium]